MRTFAVCFRGGMAKGAGAIGLVRFLQEENLQPKIYAGSSSGSIISAAYALGYSWEEILNGFQNLKFTSLIDIKNIISFKSLVSREKVEDALINFAGEDKRNIRIENMDNKFIALASNLKTGSLEYIQQGNLIDALVESSSYPIIFERKKKYIIDGDFLFDYSNELFNTLGAEIIIGCGFNLKKKLKFSQNPLKEAIDTYRMVQYRLYDVTQTVHRPDYEIIYNANDVGFIEFKNAKKIADRVYRHIKKNKEEFYSIIEN